MAMAPNQDTRVGGEGPDVGRPGSRARLNILGRVDDALYARALTPFVAAAPLARGFALDLAVGFYPWALIDAAGFGLLVALAFSLPALMRASPFLFVAAR